MGYQNDETDIPVLSFKSHNFFGCKLIKSNGCWMLRQSGKNI